MTSFAITGVTVTGNMGGAAMLWASVDALSARFPGARFRLLSIHPAADRAAGSAIDVVDARPLALILFYLPLAILAWPFARVGAVRRLLARLAYFRALIEADVVIDLCGVAFVDRRGLPLLVYNAACCLPAIVVGTPVAKLAQALGPFRSQPNRGVARFVLSRCAVVVARGAASLSHLRELGIVGAVGLPDVSFALEADPDAEVRAIALLPDNHRLLIVSPSEVVSRLMEGVGRSLADALSDFLSRAINAGWNVVLLPHSFGRASSKNNDLPISQAIAERLASPRATLMRLPEDPRLLRAVLGRAEVFIGCRFHSVAGALAMGVPSLTIGWSHKYREMVEMLQPGDWVLDWRDFNADAAFARFEALAAERVAVAAEIRARLPEIRRRAAENIALAAEAVRG